ncbi:MAG: PIN domain-containing protein [Alphaproteobacteria bacterium]|nr:PIN domain-containing protein [Alphaproteobacteria bacterium]
MTRVVLDCSMTMAWCFDDEADAQSEHALEEVGRDGASVPAIWALEVGNVLLVAERARRLTEVRSARFLAFLGELSIVVAMGRSTLPEEDLLRCARRTGLSLYDASYLLLAMRENLPLATRDIRLTKAAAASGVRTMSRR